MNFIVDALLPPAGLAVLALALVLAGQRFRLAAGVVLAALLVLGMPVVATALLNSLAPPQAVPGAPPRAIVILSGDAVRMPGLDDLQPGPLTLDRMRAGAALQRATGLPLLVSGGEFLNAHTTLAQMMTASLTNDFRVPVTWEENRSLDTWQNAAFSADILRAQGITRIYLVTHAWHMRRALLAFRAFGMDPVPVPVRPPYRPPFAAAQLVPSAAAWFNSFVALHEWVGLAYYSLRR